MRLFRGGLPIVAVVALGACTAPSATPINGDPIARFLAEHTAELVDAGPGGPMVLLPGPPDAARQFATALALAPYVSITPYLAQLSGEWSDKDARYGPSGQVSEQVAVTRLAALLARSSAEYRDALFPAGRLDALRASAGAQTDQDVASSLAESVRLLDGYSTVDCGRLAAAVLARDFAAAARIAGPAPPRSRCGDPAAAIVDIVRTEAAHDATQIGGWQAPAPGQILELTSRFTWVESYSPKTIRWAMAPLADVLAGFLVGYADASAPFLPNIPADQLRLLFGLLRQARLDWRPDSGYLDYLHRTLRWHGRLPDQVRNDPTTLIFSTLLLAGDQRPVVVAALPRLRAAVVGSGDADPMDRGLRAIAAKHPDLITPDLLARAAHAVGNDPRLGARLAALVEYRGACPPQAAEALRGLLSGIPGTDLLSATYVYYYALITRAATRCAIPTPARAAIQAAASRYPDRMATVVTKPDWPGWLELWLLTEATCALGDQPNLNPDALTKAAGGMLNKPAEPILATFDPSTAYATSRTLAVAHHGCAQAWYSAER